MERPAADGQHAGPMPRLAALAPAPWVTTGAAGSIDITGAGAGVASPVETWASIRRRLIREQ